MAAPKTILIVTTSHAEIDATHPTGLWLEEFAIPYQKFIEAGYEVTVASVQGGDVPIDPNSHPTAEQETQWRGARVRLSTTAPLAAVNADEHDALFLPGGHGTMFDLPDNTMLQQIIAAYEAAGKPIGAVCHGPAALVNVKRADGRPLVEGRRITAFTDAEEREVQLADKMPFLLETRLREQGARFEAAPNWQDHTVRDGHLVTGQNPQSSGSAADAVISLLEQEQARAVA